MQAIKFNSSTKLPLKGEGGFVDFLSDNSSGISAGTNLLSGAIAGIDGADGHTSNFGAASSGALSGAGIGTSIMPGIGTAVGGVIGGVAGLLSNQAKNKAQRQEEQRIKDAHDNAISRTRKQYDQSVINKFPSEGISSFGFYEKGGNLPTLLASYLAEKGEVVEKASPQEVIQTDKNGETSKLSSNAELIKGASHESKSRGVGMKGGERIFSDDLEVDNDFLSTLKTL